MKIIADTHTHTIASGHAYSTLRENADAAANAGLLFLASTDHTGQIPGAPSDIYFRNKDAFPKQLSGVHILYGCEVNIIDFAGGLDLPQQTLAGLEWVVASFHYLTLKPGTVEDHTRAWLGVAANPHVDVIGHCGNGTYQFDYEPVIQEFAIRGKIVEINTHSFKCRPNSAQNCRTVALLCKKYRVSVVISSDAHSEALVGNFEAGIRLLEEIDFPEDLVLNADERRFADIAQQKSGRAFI